MARERKLHGPKREEPEASEEATEFGAPPFGWDQEEPAEDSPTVVGERAREGEGTATRRARRRFSHVAPEVNRSKERPFVPRKVMSGTEVLEGLGQALDVAASQRNQRLEHVWRALRSDLLPLAQQAIEQHGDDGVDVYVSRLMHPPGRRPREKLFDEVTGCLQRMSGARGLDGLLSEGQLLVQAVRAAFTRGDPAPASLHALEAAFDGQLGLDVVLSALASDDTELDRHLEDLERMALNLRQQIRSMPAGLSAGLFANVGRLETEEKLLRHERKRRRTAR